ncbi:MAG: hypothetical protein AAGA77_07210 [Bacteroidota bacterium]
MFKYILAALWSFVMIFTSSAQTDTTKTELTTSFRLQAIQADFTDLNNSITDQYPLINETLIGLGGELGYQAGRLSAGITFVSYKGNEEDSQLLTKSTFSGYGTGLVLGHDFVTSSTFNISANLEFGIRKFKISLHDRISFSIEDILETEPNVLRFENFGEYLDLGLGLSKFFNVPYYKIGFQLALGYRWDNGKWKHKGVNSIMDEVTEMGGLFGAIQIILVRTKT